MGAQEAPPAAGAAAARAINRAAGALVPHSAVELCGEVVLGALAACRAVGTRCYDSGGDPRTGACACGPRLVRPGGGWAGDAVCGGEGAGEREAAGNGCGAELTLRSLPAQDAGRRQGPPRTAGVGPAPRLPHRRRLRVGQADECVSTAGGDRGAPGGGCGAV